MAKLSVGVLFFTGGASQLPGLRDLAQMILDKQVRLGRPIRLNGLPDAVSGPAFSTAAGFINLCGFPQPRNAGRNHRKR